MDVKTIPPDFNTTTNDNNKTSSDMRSVPDPTQSDAEPCHAVSCAATTSTSTPIRHQRLLSCSRCLACPLQARLRQLHVCRASCLPPTTPTGRTQCCSTSGVPTSSLRPRHWRPRDTALVACAGTSQFQAGVDGVPCAERYGAVDVPESTCSGI